MCVKYRGSLLGNDSNTKAATDLHWDGLGNSREGSLEDMMPGRWEGPAR